MANRVVFGLHGGVYKFRISKPGVDVLTAGINDMLFSDALQDRMVQRIISSSVVCNTGVNTAVTHPNYGAVPYIFYRASPDTTGNAYYYINYNFQIHSRTATGFSIFNGNTANQRVFYWLWIV